MLSVELAHLANILEATGHHNFSEQAKGLSSRIHDAIWKTTVLQSSIPCTPSKSMPRRLWIIYLHTRQTVRIDFF